MSDANHIEVLRAMVRDRRDFASMRLTDAERLALDAAIRALTAGASGGGDDLAMMVRRLVRAIRRGVAGPFLCDAAMALVERTGHAIEPLRATPASPAAAQGYDDGSGRIRDWRDLPKVDEGVDLPDALDLLAAAPQPQEGVTCNHEPYLGACVHCGCGFRDGVPVFTPPAHSYGKTDAKTWAEEVSRYAHGDGEVANPYEAFGFGELAKQDDLTNPTPEAQEARDAARLDFLLDNCAVVKTDGKQWRVEYEWLPEGTEGPFAATKREAIDAAMAAGGEGESC